MKKIILTFIIFITVVAGLTWLFHFFTTGTLSVSSSSQNAEIVITKPGDSHFSEKGVNHLKLKLHTGTYLVSVQGASRGISQSVSLAAHHTISLSLDPPVVSGAEPVTDFAPYSVAASKTTLYYLDRNNRYLYRIDSENNVSLVNNSVAFASIKWLDSTRGVGSDKNGKLFSIIDGGVKELALPALAEGYDLAPDGTLYISHGLDVYKGPLGGNLSKFYLAKKDFNALFASVDGVTIADIPAADTAKPQKPYVLIIRKSGQTAPGKIALSGSVAWSPDAKHLVVAGNSAYKIYDANLKEVADLPNNLASNVLWLDNDNLVYSVNDQLWSYKFSAKRASLLANMPMGGTILNIAPDDSRSYLYAMLTDAAGNMKMDRIGLAGQRVNSQVYLLQSVMPEDLGDYSMDMINFTAPVIYVQSNSDSPANLFIGKAQEQLKAQGFNIRPEDIRAK
jgi:hypothetical protein